VRRGGGKKKKWGWARSSGALLPRQKKGKFVSFNVAYTTLGCPKMGKKRKKKAGALAKSSPGMGKKEKRGRNRHDPAFSNSWKREGKKQKGNWRQATRRHRQMVTAKEQKKGRDAIDPRPRIFLCTSKGYGGGKNQNLKSFTRN